MSKMGISIVVPVYNVEKYLDGFLKSIYQQSFKNFEVILVNDGSTDDSEKIILKYKEQHKNIIYVTQENSGQSEARNNALKYIKGKYTLYLDPDDFIEKDMLEKLFICAEKYDADIVICGYRKVYDYDNSRKNEIVYNVNENYNYNNKEILKKIINFQLDGYLWNKLFLTDNIIKNNIYFEKGRIIEDLFPVCQLINHAKIIRFINKPLYNYRQHSNSTLHKIRSVKALEDHDFAYKNVCKLIKNESDLKITEYYSLVANIQLGHIKECKRIGVKLNKDIYKKYIIEEISLYKIIFKMKISFKIKIKLMMYNLRILHYFV